MRDFKKLKIWEESYSLSLEIYNMTKSFPSNEQYGITSQLRRAAVSIPANIAEGCGKRTSNDLMRYIDISLGSACEVETYLMLCKDLKYIEDGIFESIEAKLLEIKRMLAGYSKAIKTNSKY